MDGYDEPEEFATNTEAGKLSRFRDFLARTEKVYLEILRAAALLVATVILAWIAWLLVSSAYKISRDADAVEVAPVTLTAKEVADIDIGGDAENGEAEADAREKATVFERFRGKYYALYQSAFEKYRHKDDKKLTEEQFADRFLQGFELAEADPLEVASGTYVDESDYAGLLDTMRKAGALPVTIGRLEKYRDTPKVRVEDQVKRTREEEYCEYYSDYFGECYYYGTRTVPYTQTVARMEVPHGVLTPSEIFAAYQDNYLNTLYSRREKSSSDANAEKAERLAANEEGWLGLNNALWFGGLFLGLMFFFLLIAIERHQRLIAAKLD